ncbi:HNH endonuclease [Neisseria flavescens]|nr:HNH endonuclease [Neisseria flavescens]
MPACTNVQPPDVGGRFLSSIPDYTWHHHQDTGRMQLVPEEKHSPTGHIGSRAMDKGK